MSRSQFTRKFMQARFDMLAKEVGWNTESYFVDYGLSCATRIGFTALEYSPFGGYFVTQVTNSTGAEKNINGGSRMKARELFAWFEGIRAGIRAVKEQYRIDSWADSGLGDRHKPLIW